MQKMICMILIALAVPCMLAADQPGAMLPAAGSEASTGVFTPEIYFFRDRDDNLTWPRKYEGQRDELWSIGTLRWAGYNGGWQSFIEGNDILSGNTLLRGDFGYADTLWFRASTANVSRRTPLMPFTPTAEQGEVLRPAGITADTRFIIERSENSARVYARPFGTPDIAIFGDVLREDDRGTRPLAFRTRLAPPDPETGPPIRTKFEVLDSVDQITSDRGIGASFQIGPASLYYRGATSDYRNLAPGPSITPDFNPDEPIRRSRFEDTTTHSHSVKLSWPLGEKVALTGNWITRDRTHKVAGILLTNVDQTTSPGSVTTGLETTTLALRYTPTSDLVLTARFRDFDLDRNSPLITVTSGESVELENQSINRDEKEGELDASYTGFRRTIVRTSFKIKQIDRTERPVHQDIAHPEPEIQEEWSHPPIALSTDWKTFRLGVTSYLVPNVTLRADWKTSDIEHSTFHGTPSDIDDLNTEVTFAPKDDLALFASWRRLREDNRDIPPPGFLTVATAEGSAEEYQLRRESSAGAQYSNDVDTIVVGLYKSLGTRLTFDANYMHDKVESQAYWVLGLDPNYTPHIGGEGDTTGLPPELVPYKATNKIWQAGLTYTMNTRWSLRANFLSGRTDGMTTTDSLFRLVSPVGDKRREWQPLNVDFWRAALGVSYQWSPAQRLLLEISQNAWDDDIEQMFDGRYTLVTMALETRF